MKSEAREAHIIWCVYHGLLTYTFTSTNSWKLEFGKNVPFQCCSARRQKWFNSWFSWKFICSDPPLRCLFLCTGKKCLPFCRVSFLRVFSRADLVSWIYSERGKMNNEVKEGQVMSLSLLRAANYLITVALLS